MGQQQSLEKESKSVIKQRRKQEQAYQQEQAVPVGPWRTVRAITWEERGLQRMKSELINTNLPSPNSHLPWNTGIMEVNILVVGQVGGGKSSFLTSVASAMNDKKVDIAEAGASYFSRDIEGASMSMTKKLRKNRIRNEKHQLLKLAFFDTMGLESANTGLNIDTTAAIIDGYIKPDADLEKINLKYALGDGKDQFKRNPELKDMMHGIIFVIQAGTFTSMDKSTVDKMMEIWSYARNKDPEVPSIIILTGIDAVCDDVAADTSKIFSSVPNHKLAKIVSRESGFPINKIFPQRNYVEEVEKDTKIDCLTLFNVQQIMTMAEQYCFKLIDRE